MSQATLRHTTALCHAQSALRSVLDKPLGIHGKREVENDIELLEELKKIILRSIYAAGPTFDELPKHEGD